MNQVPLILNQLKSQIKEQDKIEALEKKSKEVSESLSIHLMNIQDILIQLLRKAWADSLWKNCLSQEQFDEKIAISNQPVKANRYMTEFVETLIKMHKVLSRTLEVG